jgi:hypothetical protein
VQIVSSLGSTSQLAHTLAMQRAIRRQVVAVALLVTAAAIWRLSPLHEPEPFTLAAIAVGSAILLIELTIAWSERGEADHYADDLILAGFSEPARRTPIGCAVARRLARLQSPRARRRLAEGLRWRVRLANGWTRPSPGYVRASAYPPLRPAQRQVFQEDSELIALIATRIQREAGDPRALIILERIITLPPNCDPHHRATIEADEVRQQLHSPTVDQRTDRFVPVPSRGRERTAVMVILVAEDGGLCSHWRQPDPVTLLAAVRLIRSTR